MKTIIKAILRFFKFSKLSFIGLFFLIFFSSTTFTTLNNVTINLNESYKKITSEGNLHDFVINENYRYGDGPFLLNTSSNTNSFNGNVNVVSITKNGELNSPNSYSVSLSLNKDLSLDENSNFKWTYAYLQILQENSKEFQQFVSFSVTIESSSDINMTNWTSNDSFVSELDNKIKSKKIDLDIYVKEQYKNFFISNLEKEFNVSVRSFESLNINNTKQNIFFKLIESNPNYSIDKLVVYDGNNLTETWDNSIFDINKYNSEDFKNNKKLSRDLIPYIYRANWSGTEKFEDLYNYVVANENYNPYSNTNNQEQIPSKVTKQSKIFKNIIDTQGISNKGYSVTFSYRIAGTIPVSGTIEDFSSYEAIISPNYLSKLNKKPIKYDEWINHKNDKQEEFDNWLRTLPDENKIFIDNQEFVIMGTGVSPDFMYPIVSFENVVPNPEKEQIVYANNSGFLKMTDGFRGNEQENFLIGKFENQNNIDKQIKQINDFTKNYMGWPDNINSTFKATDISNSISPTALRLQFIPNIVLAITTVSAFLTSFISALSLFISIVIIQRFIQTNRNSLGIMQANGYKKWEIILGICILIAIPVVISTVLGFTMGFSLQAPALNLIKSFWTLPTTLESFSLSTLSGLLISSIAGFLLITICFSSYALRGETAEFMKDEAKYKMTKIAMWMKKPFTKFNIMVRFRSAIAFSSIWRIILLALMSALLMMSFNFSLNVLNTFKYSAEKTFGSKNYKYSINLITPTLQSGQYYTVPVSSQGKVLDKNQYFNLSNTFNDLDLNNSISQNYIKSSSYEKYLDINKPTYNPVFYSNVIKYGNYQLISQEDSTAQDNDVMYLKFKSTSKPFADLSLGIGSLSTNPWNLATQLMPPNNANYANQSFKKTFESAVANNETLINIGILAKTNSQNKEVLNSKEYELKTFYEYIKEFCKFYAVKKDETNSNNFKEKTTEIPTIEGVDSSKIQIVSNDEINNNQSAFYSLLDSNKSNTYNYYYQFDDKKTTGNSGSVIKTEVNINYLNLLYSIYSSSLYENYTYSINYGKLVVGNRQENESNNDTPYSYAEFNLNKINNISTNITDNFKAIGLLPNDNRIFLTRNGSNITNKLSDNKPIIENGNTIYPVIINEYLNHVYGFVVGDLIEIDLTNTADRFSREHFGLPKAKTYLKVIDITETYQGAEFYMNQYDVNKILGLTINNVKPKVPTNKQEIKSYVSWDNLEYDYGQTKSSQNNNQTNIELSKREEFVASQSGFNGLFSKSETDLPTVTGGLSLYSVSGIYPGVDKIDANNLTLKKVLTGKNAKENIETIIYQTGFYDLAVWNSNNTINKELTAAKWEEIVNQIAKVFGSSASFSIVSGAEYKDSALNIIQTISSTSTDIQNIIFGMIIVIVVIIISIISSIIINDSMKLAAILKCLGLADRNNALSFLSVFFPVFVAGLLLSIPMTLVIQIMYQKIILGFTGIVIIFNYVWWHFIVAALGVILIFGMSYWVAWNRIASMNLPNSIK